MERCIAVQSDVFLDILGIDHAAVAERDSHLLGIEFGLAQRQDLSVLMNCLRVKEILADRSLNDVLVNDPLGSLGRCLGIESAFRIYDHDRAQCTEAKTSRLDDQYILQSLRFYLVLQRLYDLMAAGRSTSCTAADKDLLAVSRMLSHFLCFGSD